ncbi:MAG TPA: ABC transporter substrate-binding protein [Gammaproteobacteria bacterium]|jgi:phospholipid transport system substrate-binding protein|nr:ABC transporter substrate-binding protein [Gammaproteobacteria bacterium]
MRTKILLAAVISFASFAALADSPAPSTAPDQVVQQTAKAMFDMVNSKKAELEKNPQELYDQVGKILLPHFDFQRASLLVLGQYGRSANDAQKKAFQDAFYRYLVHGYSDALLKGNYSERNVQVEPFRAGSDSSRAYVKTKVMREGAPPVQVDYWLQNENGDWKAFDVVIEGISYVLNYRNQFGPEIQKNGLDALIKRLNSDADKGIVQAPAGKT